MPLKINWMRGKYLGISLLFLGIMGIVQALVVVPFGQYVVDIGSLYVLIMVPVVSSFLLTHSTQILYESYAQSPKRKFYRDKGWKQKVRLFLQRELIRPVLIVVFSFLVIFFIFYGIFSGLAAVNSFVVAENVGAIGILLFTVVLEKRIVPPD